MGDNRKMNGAALRHFAAASVGKTTDECWLWPGMISNQGYGSVFWNGRQRVASRISYERQNGPIPEGLVPDHLCRVRHCVNPWHLEIVTVKENNLRGFGEPAMRARQNVCINGHPFDRIAPRSDQVRRMCSICNREDQRKGSRAYRARNRDLINARRRKIYAEKKLTTVQLAMKENS